MSDDIQTTESVEATTETQETATTEERYDFVLDKYRAEGRTEAEAMQLQAQSYSELQSKFGSFTGAPEEYEALISEELTEAGVELVADDPMLEKAFELGKELNMSQEGMSKLINMYAEIQLAENKAYEEQRAENMKQLGNNAAARIEGINKWIDANLDNETAQGLRGIATTAEGIKAIEQLISKTKSAPVAPQDSTPVPSVTPQEVQAMQFAKDEHGNRKINTDPEFKKEYQRKRDALYGTQEHRQMIG
jgi:hypothetical protein